MNYCWLCCKLCPNSMSFTLTFSANFAKWIFNFPANLTMGSWATWCYVKLPGDYYCLSIDQSSQPIDDLQYSIVQLKTLIMLWYMFAPSSVKAVDRWTGEMPFFYSNPIVGLLNMLKTGFLIRSSEILKEHCIACEPKRGKLFFLSFAV